MAKYNIKFVVINQIPTGTDEADRLSLQMTQDFGLDGWQLVSSLGLSGNGLLLTFQKETL
jgi:hypothetical protein